MESFNFKILNIVMSTLVGKGSFLGWKGVKILALNQTHKRTNFFIIWQMFDKKVENYIFSLKNKVGQGSYGSVFAGLNEKTSEKVAVKILAR